MQEINDIPNSIDVWYGSGAVTGHISIISNLKYLPRLCYFSSKTAKDI